MKSFKVEVLAFGETRYVSNAIRYATREKAEDAGADLFSRWTAVKEWRVAESEDDVYPSATSMPTPYIIDDEEAD